MANKKCDCKVAQAVEQLPHVYELILAGSDAAFLYGYVSMNAPPDVLDRAKRLMDVIKRIYIPLACLPPELKQ